MAGTMFPQDGRPFFHRPTERSDMRIHDLNGSEDSRSLSNESHKIMLIYRFWFFIIVVHSCFGLPMLILIPWFSLKSRMFRNSKFDLSGRGGAHFLLGRCFPFPSKILGTAKPDPVQQGDSWGRPKAQGQAKSGHHQLIWGNLPIIYMVYHGFIHSRWLFGISSIDSMVFSQNDAWPGVLLDICPDRLESVPLVLWTGPW